MFSTRHLIIQNQLQISELQKLQLHKPMELQLLMLSPTRTILYLSLLTVKAGDAYPNSMLGDIVIELPAGVSAIQLQDLSRFEKADGAIDLDFAEGFKGNIYAIAKWAGVREAA